MSECKKYKVTISSEIDVEVFAKDAVEAQDLAWEHCQENSGHFARWANIEKTEEVELKTKGE